MSTIRRTNHPRPDRARKNWQTLNGSWQFRFDWNNEGKKQRWYAQPAFDLTIHVPFAYQAALSGVDEKKHCDVLWYAREMNCV